MKRASSIALLGAALAACGGESTPETGASSEPLVDVTRPPERASLLVLEDHADWPEVVRAVDRTEGTVFHVLPPRMIVARVPERVQPVLDDLGVTARFDRAVEPGQLPDASVAETRFASVFSNRYWRDEIDPVRRIAADDAGELDPDEGGLPDVVPSSVETLSLDPGVDAESRVSVPYAAGTVVVSVVLPESNGTAEPSTEDWDDKMILAVYDKIQAALEAVSRHEPNAGLRFVLHYESAPAPGGLPGTVDTDLEFGKHADYGQWQDERRAQADVLSSILGREVTESDLHTAQLEYVNDLRDRYDADGAFYVIVAANGNGTANLRPHASFNGPYTTLDSTTGWRTFMHEFGHIFGAQDEYCPDACRSPSILQGYLGIVNANARYRPGDDGGINGGQGEDQPSLMMYNRVNRVNGYTRGAWGWLDSDGDGILEVLDTFPRTDVEAVVDGNRLRLVGEVVDVPATRRGGTPFSVNRITALEYRVDGSPWLRVPVPDSARGRASIDLELGALPAGEHTVAVRAENSVGNVEPTPQRLTVSVDSGGGNTAPHLSLPRPPAVSTGAPATLRADVVDLDGDVVEVRFDLDGDGVFDTGWGPPVVQASFDEAGLSTIVAEARDPHGAIARARTSAYVLADDVAPSVRVTGDASPIAGSSSHVARFDGEAFDPDGDAVEYRWIAELASADETWTYETKFGADPDFEVELETPLGLDADTFDLTAGDEALANAPIHDVVEIAPDTLAIALGGYGLATVDISDPAAPALLARIELETTAEHLYRSGSRLYVLGGQLAIVDISDGAAPVEIEQWMAERNTRRLSEERAMPIGDSGAYHGLRGEWREKIRRLQVRVTLEHPDPSQLTVELLPPKDNPAGPIVLWDREAGPAGRATYVFTQGNTPELADHVGAFGGGSWSVRVTDHVKDEATGSLVASTIRFRTEHRAIPVIGGANTVVGALPDGYLAVAGRGLQVLDVYFPQLVGEVSRLSGTGTLGATLHGSTAVVMSPLEPPEPPEPEGASQTSEQAGWTSHPDTRGLYAVDLSWPQWPAITRMEPIESREFAAVGSRMYYGAPLAPPPPGPIEPLGKARHVTTIGDLDAFVAGQEHVVGTTDRAVSPDAFGDDAIVWTHGPQGMLEKLDVSDPADVRVLAQYVRPPIYRMVPLADGRIVVPRSRESLLVDPDRTISTVSRVFTITLEARDEAGAVGRATRTVHLVPYAHPPTVTGLDVVRGSTERDQWELLARVDDPDGRPSWDPHRFVRADFDGDGHWDTGWEWTGDDGARLYPQFDEPGTYPVRVQARDGFWGTDEATFAVEVEAFEPTPCTAAEGCPSGQVCRFALDQMCGDAGEVGVCEPTNRHCRDEPFDEVCGCDGRTYPNECEALRNGTSVEHEGACVYDETPCAENADCRSGEYCAFDQAAQCGSAGDGLCSLRPDICTFITTPDPVCGCDGQTYSSSCNAAQAGVSVAHDGGCEQ